MRKGETQKGIVSLKMCAEEKIHIGEIAENLILLMVFVEMKSCVQLMKHGLMEIIVSF